MKLTNNNRPNTPLNTPQNQDTETPPDGNVADITESGIFMLDRDGIVTHANPFAAVLFSQSTDKLCGKPFSGLLPEKSRKAFAGLLEEALRLRKTRTFSDSGTTVRIIPLLTESGETKAMVVVGETADAGALLERGASRQHLSLQSLLDSLPYPLYVIDAKTRLVKIANEAAFPGEYIGQLPCDTLVRGKNLPCDRKKGCPLDIVLETKRHVVLERIIRRDGGERFIEIHGYPIFDNDKNVTEVIEYYIDTTDRKRSEFDTLKLTMAIEQSSNLVIITDIDGNIEFVNTAVEKLTGFSKEEVIGKNPRALKTNYHSADFYRSMWKIISSGETWHGRFLNRKKDGDTYWANAMITPVKDENGKVVKYIGIQEDITDRKQAEDELKRAKDEAERANRLKSLFLANVSHEIRTPMNSILGFAELLLAHENSPEKTEYIELIRSSGKQLLEIINDILDFSKIEAGKVEIDRTNFAMRKMIWNLHGLFQLKTDEKNIEYVVTVDEDFPEIVNGDQRRLSQVLTNLLGNAFKFTGSGKIEMTCRYREGVAVIRISDTGIGIPAAKQKEIFAAFEQADASINRRFGGTGLGLAISKSLVTLMNGTIDLESTPEQGSVFTVTLPLPSVMQDTQTGPDDDEALLKSEITGESMVRRWIAHMQGDTELEEIALDAISRLPSQVASLETAIRTGKKEEILFILQEMKGTSGNLGWKEIYDLCNRFPAAPGKTLKNDLLVKLLRDFKSILSLIPERYFKSHYAQASRLEQESSRIRILVAEHMPVHLKPIQSAVKQLNAEADFAENVESMMEKLYRFRYDLLLLDVSLPKASPELIRKIKSDPLQKNTRIVIISAAPVPEKSSLFLDAGSDGMFVKPLKKGELMRYLIELKTRNEEVTEQIDKETKAKIRLSGASVKKLRRIADGLRKNIGIFDAAHVRNLAIELAALSDERRLTDIAGAVRQAAIDFDEHALEPIIISLEEIADELSDKKKDPHR